MASSAFTVVTDGWQGNQFSSTSADGQTAIRVTGVNITGITRVTTHVAVASLTRSGVVATVTVTAGHGIPPGGAGAGQLIQIVDAVETLYNGVFPVLEVVSATVFTYAVPVSGADPTTPATGTIYFVRPVATATTAFAHGLRPGDQIIVYGASQAAYNGTMTVLTTPSSTTFTYLVLVNGTSSADPVTPATGSDLHYVVVGQVAVIDDMLISVGTAMTVTLLMETTNTVLMTLYLPANSVGNVTLRNGIRALAPSKRIYLDASVAGNISVLCNWH